MEHLEIRKASPGQAPELAVLARGVWREHFTPIIGAGQVEYMLRRFQSEEAVRGQMEREGYVYYFFLWDGEKAGYMGVRAEGDALFLSKLYLKKEFRGRKISRAATDFLLGVCRERGLPKVRLQVTDIGNGYVMDDYVLERAADGVPPQARPGV